MTAETFDPTPELETSRLRLRPWRDSDLAPFAAINADPDVMEHFPAPLNRAESDVLARRWRGMFATHGFGMWAVEEKAIGDVPGTSFIGFVGLSVPAFVPPFGPCVEAGWRLGHAWWGRGYATEAARAALAFGFDTLGLGEIVAYTATGNTRSRAVMERLGMKYDPADDFIHSRLPEDEPLRFHVLYRLGREAFAAGGAGACKCTG